MKQFVLLLTALTLALTACEKDDPITILKDPALAWNAESFEATIGSENVFPTLTNTYQVPVTYSSSKPEIATIDSNGTLTLVSSGSTLITASFTANEAYTASSTSYLLTVVSTSNSDAYDGSLTFPSTGDPESDDDISTTTFKGKITIQFSQSGDAVVTGDSYGYVSVDGNHVTVNNTGGEVLIYELTGATANGSFKVYGAKKQAIVLNGVSLTNPNGAALNNQNKKRTFIAVYGNNTLSDSESAAYAQVGEEDLKAVLFSEAQLVFSGSGLLTVNALNKQE